MHLRTHTGAGAGAVGEDEIGDPNFFVEGGVGELGSGLIGECEVGDYAEGWERGLAGASG
jgi:hypothetical protein